jgi:hypothetical protein
MATFSDQHEFASIDTSSKGLPGVHYLLYHDYFQQLWLFGAFIFIFSEKLFDKNFDLF